MTSTGYDAKRTIRRTRIDEPIRSINPSRPESLKIAFQRFWFSNPTFHTVPFNVPNKIIDLA